MKWPFSYVHIKVIAGFLLTVGVLVALAFYSFSTTQRLIHTARLLAHASRVISLSHQTLSLVTDMETAQRGYVITFDETYLEPYYQAKDTVYKLTANLEELIQDNQVQLSRVEKLNKLIREKEIGISGVIDARRMSMTNAQQLIISGAGKKLMDDIRNTVEEIQQEERTLFLEQNTIGRAQLQQFQYGFMGLLFLTIVIVLILFFLINSNLRARRKTEELLKNASTEIQELYDEAPCGYLSVGADIYFTNVNQTLINWLGYSRNELIGKMQYPDLLSDESREKFEATFEQDFKDFKEKGFVNDLEFEFKRKDGTVFPVIVNSMATFDENGNFVKSRTTVFDNTQRKRTEAKFKALLESSPDALIIVNDKGIIQLVNNQSKNTFGYERSELVGRPVEILIPNQHQEKHAGHRIIDFAQPKARRMGSGMELFGLRKNGEEFPIEISLSPLETEEGLLVSAAIRDITERKLSENTIRQLNKELESFSYSVSHDLRAPLRAIGGYARILDEDYGNEIDEEGKKAISTITRNANRMGQLIDDLLEFSRMGRKELMRGIVDMYQIVKTIVEEHQEGSNGREVEWKIGKLQKVKADLDMIRQVWYNLISNALKYSRNTKITCIEIGCQQQQDEIQFFVRDNGAGFDMQYVHKLFEVFQRLHKIQEFEGTGVGLALVKRIISRHGGRVWADAKLNEGAIFYFSLPAN